MKTKPERLKQLSKVLQLRKFLKALIIWNLESWIKQNIEKTRQKDWKNKKVQWNTELIINYRQIMNKWHHPVCLIFTFTKTKAEKLERKKIA